MLVSRSVLKTSCDPKTFHGEPRKVAAPGIVAVSAAPVVFFRICLFESWARAVILFLLLFTTIGGNADSPPRRPSVLIDTEK